MYLCCNLVRLMNILSSLSFLQKLFLMTKREKASCPDPWQSLMVLKVQGFMCVHVCRFPAYIAAKVTQHSFHLKIWSTASSCVVRSKGGLAL